MIEERHGISFKMLLSICGVFLIPCLGVILTVLIFVIKDDDKLTVIKDKQDKQEIFNGDIKTQLDTVKNRQERYHYESNSRFNDLEKKKK